MRGFSLVELSIVLVILGLLTGGILGGQSLIRAAELRSVANDLSRYSTSLHTFRDKYFGWPGDMTNATQFWGTASTCPNGTGTGTQTCDGNGNGVIDNVSNVFYENMRAWQQLGNAGLVEGSYTGVQTNTPRFVLGTNQPRMRLNNGGYTLVSFGLAYGNAFCSTITGAGNMCWPNQAAAIALFGGTIGDTTRNPIIKPEELWNIDTKLDDGRPDLGIIQSGNTGASPGCTTGTATPATYNLSSAEISCNITAIINR
ncbi:MAG: hypothetical protein DI582_10415 [Azospirillum brasilense]|nr:MAG: hypothetical protein DI582_10415 [Azospirillum brasilense]